MFRRLSDLVRLFSQKRSAVICACGVLTLAGCLFIAARCGIPEPLYFSENSFLLAADTYSHGRITNPAHPYWEFFETFNVLSQPTYASRFPPAQGAVFALGKIIFGHPIAGVWISCAAMSMAVCWMLYAFLPPVWAMAGGLVTVVQFGVFSIWCQNYWTGAVAATGTALALGAIGRIFRQRASVDIFWLCLGAGVVLNSRPMEGVLLALPISFLVLPVFRRFQWTLAHYPAFLRKVGISMLIFFMALGAWTCWFNAKVTGNPSQSPYFLYRKTYTFAPLMTLGAQSPMPTYHHRVMAEYETQWTARRYRAKKDLKTLPSILWREDILPNFLFYFGYPLAFPFLLIVVLKVFAARMRWRHVGASVIVLLWTTVLIYSVKPQYLAPLLPFVIICVINGLRYVSRVRVVSMKIGGWMICLLILAQLLWIPTHYVLKGFVSQGMVTLAPTGISLNGMVSRKELEKELLHLGGRHLVFVKYLPAHLVILEWVYNSADIDGATIVWARDMGDEKNKVLVDYFKDRQVTKITAGFNDRFFLYRPWVETRWPH